MSHAAGIAGPVAVGAALYGRGGGREEGDKQPDTEDGNKAEASAVPLNSCNACAATFVTRASRVLRTCAPCGTRCAARCRRRPAPACQSPGTTPVRGATPPQCCVSPRGFSQVCIYTQKDADSEQHVVCGSLTGGEGEADRTLGEAAWVKPAAAGPRFPLHHEQPRTSCWLQLFCSGCPARKHEAAGAGPTQQT